MQPKTLLLNLKELLVNSEKIYEEAINILTSQGKFYINLGLERIGRILEIMGSPQDKLSFVHVAGTNGKGSVCAMLSSILITLTKQYPDDELKIGLFTSPHVFEYTERIKINDVEISKEIFAQKVIKVTSLADKNQIHLTEFEILTAVALDYFAQNKVDIVILETGLGGRLDATNIVENKLCTVITSIDLDHTERLGSTIEEIAMEKAGIIRPNCPVIVSKNNPGYKTIFKVAIENQCRMYIADEINNPYIGKSSLKGDYQKENFALVLKIFEFGRNKGIIVAPKIIEQGLQRVKHPCRFEFLKDKNIIIDGAHNPNGTMALRKSLDEKFPNQKFNFIFGCLNNKDYTQMMKNLFTEKDEIYFYTFNNPNSCNFDELQGNCDFKAKPFIEYENNKNLTVICGSFYMIKELLSKMGIK